MKKIRIPIIFVILLSVVLCLALPGASAQKEEPKEYQLLRYMNKEKSEEVFQVQAMLLKLGYFEDGPTFAPGYFDEVTLTALRLFCADNHLNLPSDGITPEIQKFLLEMSPSPRVTPAPTPVPVTPTPAVTASPFPSITKGASDNAVNDVQDALFRLGYFEDIDGSAFPGRYDDVTEEAVRRFCEVARLQYVPEVGLTDSLYRRIMSTDAPTQRPKETPEPVSMVFFGTSGEDVREAQQKLKDLDYFRDVGDPEWGVYEERTQRAVERFCEVNGIPTNPNGMDSGFLDRLNSDGAVRNPLPFAPIRRGAGDKTVDEVQRRLNELGYYKGRKQTGTCDDDMITALTLFAQANNVAFENETVTKELYDRIMDENAVKYTDTVEQKGFFERVKDSLTGSVNFLGIRMPAFLMILLVVIILSGLVFLLVRTFGADGKNGESKHGGGDPLKDSWNFTSGAAQGSNRVELEVRFRGSSQRVTVSLDKPLRIGRTEHTLPINESDSDISRHHCQMYFRGDALLLRDYSTNGTSVNHKPYHNCECVIHSGDILNVGNHEITVRIL